MHDDIIMLVIAGLSATHENVKDKPKMSYITKPILTTKLKNIQSNFRKTLEGRVAMGGWLPHLVSAMWEDMGWQSCHYTNTRRN